MTTRRDAVEGAAYGPDTDPIRGGTVGAAGPISWHDRARANTLPTMIVGGVPRHDVQQGADAASPRGIRSLPVAMAAASGSRPGR